jgi:hypothetical protein
VLEIDHHGVIAGLMCDAHHIGGPAAADAEHQRQLLVRRQAAEERVPAVGPGLRIQHDYSSPSDHRGQGRSSPGARAGGLPAPKKVSIRPG